MKLLAASSLCALALGACASDSNEPPFVDVDGDGVNDNDPTALRTFTMKVENVAPFTILKSGVQRTKPDKVDGNLAPGEYYEIRFTAGVGHRLSLASMLLESNDWFFGTDPAGIPLYNNGVPISGDITNQIKLWDAGTEYDQEPGVGADTGLLQATRTQGAVDPDHRVRLVESPAKLSNGTTFQRPDVPSMIQVTVTPGLDRSFVVRITNVSTTNTLVTSAGNKAITVTPVLFVIACDTDPNPLFDQDQPPRDNGIESLAESANADAVNDKLRLLRGIATPLTKGVYAVHAGGNPFFIDNQPDGHLGLEKLAEDGDPSALLASLEQGIILDAESYGAVTTPMDASAEAPCAAGQAYELTFQARPGDRLSLVTGFGASDDWFFSPPGEGMLLFNGNLPRWGEITTEFRLYDAGTERDEELDVGVDVGTQQTAPNTGRDDSTKLVREVGRDRYDVPLTRHIRVTLTPPMR